MEDELLDLVDKNDVVVGTINRKDYSKMLAENLGYIRAVELFLIDSKGRIFVPIRTADKTIAPNGFDYSAAGHVEAGEDYQTTVLRETKEELDLTIKPADLTCIAKTVTDDIRYIRCIYIVRTNTTPALNPEDFVSAEWLFPDELMAKIDAGHPAKSSLRETVCIAKDYLEQH